MNLVLPILNKYQSNNLIDFISHWSKLYAYGSLEKYNKIHNVILSENDLKELYEWKNGIKLSVAKENSLNSKIIQKIHIINEFKLAQKVEMDAFLNEFSNVSAVWKIFLLHIIKPYLYPIYDQHIHRAYRFLNSQPTDGVKPSMSDAGKLKFYFKEYLPFVRAAKIRDVKKMDEAFFAFGQFINIGNQKILVE